MNLEKQTKKYAQAIRAYHQNGWHVIPCVTYEFANKEGKKTREKRPLVDWEKYQEKAPTKDEIEGWLSDPKIMKCLGLGIVTGTSQGVVGVDFDQKDGKPNTSPWAEDMIDVMYTITASGGMHAYYRADPTKTPQNATNIFNASKEKGETIVDIRGKGGFIVVGPTVLWSSDPRNDVKSKPVSQYKTFNVTSPTTLTKFPETFRRQHATATDELPKRWERIASDAVVAGTRHDTALSVIAKLLYNVTGDDDVELAKRTFNQIMLKKFEDPLPQEEVDKMFTWAIEKERSKYSAEWKMAANTIKRYQKRQKEYQRFKEEKEEWMELMKGHEVVSMEKISTEGVVDLITFHLSDGTKFFLPAINVFTVKNFKLAYFGHTHISLPNIAQRSLELFLEGLPSTTSEGSSLVELIKHTFNTWTERISTTITDARELPQIITQSPQVVLVSPETTTPNRLYFRMNDLFKYIQRDSWRVRTEIIYTVVKQLGCKEETINNFKYWYYEIE